MSLWEKIKALFGFKKKTTTTTTTEKYLGGINMKRALNIGINDYPGTRNDLRGCVNDANKWRDTAERKGFDTFAMLLNEQATRSNVIKEMKAIINKSKEGDTALITYSGHGSKVPDKNGDESDKVDETWYLYDGHLIDDEIRDILSNVKKGVKVVIVSDSCHSGTVTRALFSTLSSGEYAKPRYMPPEDEVESALVAGVESVRALAYPEEGMNHILISGAKSTEYSYDAYFDKPMGAMTYYATKIIDDNPDMTYLEFYNELRKQLPSSQYPQTPQLEGNDELKNSKIF